MTPEQAKDLIGRITYKPHWQIHANIRPDYDMRLHIRVKFESIDSGGKYQPSGKLFVENRFIFSALELAHMDEKYFVSHFYDCIAGMEDHEQSEWFKLDGKHLYEPHPEMVGTNPDGVIFPDL